MKSSHTGEKKEQAGNSQIQHYSGGFHHNKPRSAKLVCEFPAIMM
jgi:hypothetical protein